MSSCPVLAIDKTSTQLLPGGFYSASEHQVSKPAFNGTVNETAASLQVSEPEVPLSFDRINYAGSPTALGSPPGNWSSLFLPSGWYASLESFQVLFNSVPDRGQLSEDHGITSFANGEFTPRRVAYSQGTATHHVRPAASAQAPRKLVVCARPVGVALHATDALLIVTAETAKVGGEPQLCLLTTSLSCGMLAV